MFNANDTNNRIEGIKLQINKIEFDENLANQIQLLSEEKKLQLTNYHIYKYCIDHSNFFQTQSDYDNIMRLADV